MGKKCVMRRRQFVISMMWGSLITSSHTFRKKTVPNFKVIGSKIYTPQGREFIPKGVNVGGPLWYWGRDTTQDFDLIVDKWKFNTIRINTLLKRDVNPPDQYTSSEGNADIHKIINLFTSAGVVCVVELHDHTGAYFTSTSDPSINQAISYYSNLATKYINNPYVWFNIQNEPGAISRQWLITHREIVKYIRRTGNQNIIICDGAWWGQDVGEWNSLPVKDTNSAILTYGNELINNAGAPYNNIAFSIHIYDQWRYGEYKLHDFIQRVHNKGLCLLVGEYGVFNNKPIPEAALVASAVLPTYNIGRIVWAWGGIDQNRLCIEPTTGGGGGGWRINSQNTKPTNLTQMGSAIWDDNRRLETLAQI